MFSADPSCVVDAAFLAQKSVFTFSVFYSNLKEE